MMVVYVDDFLLLTDTGVIRDGFLKQLSSVWTLAKEETLTPEHPITFLGIELEMRKNHDVLQKSNESR